MTVSFLYRLFRQPLCRYAAAVALGGIITLLSLWRNGVDYRLAYADALTTAGAALFFLGLLLWVGYLGVFDIFGYSVSSLGKRRYKDLFEYSAAHQSKRKRSGWYFVPFLTAGLDMITI